MPDIRHRVGITATPPQVYEKLATVTGLTEWWTSDTDGQAEVGGRIRFFFGQPEPSAVMEVTGLEADRHVAWRCVEGPDEWVGTTLTFDLRGEGSETVLLFTHGDWRRPVEFMHHCSTKWALFLLALKAGFEGGKATPFPQDMAISSWG